MKPANGALTLLLWRRRPGIQEGLKHVHAARLRGDLFHLAVEVGNAGLKQVE